MLTEEEMGMEQDYDDPVMNNELTDEPTLKEIEEEQISYVRVIAHNIQENRMFILGLS